MPHCSLPCPDTTLTVQSACQVHRWHILWFNRPRTRNTFCNCLFVFNIQKDVICWHCNICIRDLSILGFGIEAYNQSLGVSRERIQAWVNQNQSGLQLIHPHKKVINESQLWHQEGGTIVSLTLSAVKSEGKKFTFSLLQSCSVEIHIAQFTTALSNRTGKVILTCEKWPIWHKSN